MKNLSIKNKQVLQYYRKFRQHSPFMLVGRNAELALQSAKTLFRFEQLEAMGKVRLRMEDEQEDYFSVYGEPETQKQYDEILHQLEIYGCYWITSEYNDHCSKCDRDDWEQSDSIGMCIYKNPLDPFENGYVIDLMKSAIEHFA